ncbi:glycosyltransferase family 2 protein [Ferruginibacter albus]|uniref:glycosyltransferase family 2 protein n=1 Tax=Ferruginibacter albus TaxID=2875540 RepID=UPI001CC64392|nr:glycosyltransferase family 2 protein [Ferruginibacter albus]UAY52939.1 glycosyltransferase family 2 protein [Ferruginibacter albus]
MTAVQTTEPLISIITLNWNQTAVTCDFLESTRNLLYKNYEILVCDMASDIDPTEQISAGNYPNTKLLLAGKNLGFAGGNNWGMKQAKGDYIFIVNNDTEVTPDLLNVLLEPFLIDKSIGVTCPKIRYFSHPNVIQYAGFNPMNLYTGRTTAIGDKEEDKGQYDTSRYTYGAHGCAMMVSKDVIDKVGMFPDNFFVYYEEWDWSSRILKAGYTIYYQAKGLIYHKESLSVGKNSPLKVYYLSRNRILYMRRNTNFLQFMAFLFCFTFLAMPKAIISYIVRRQFVFLKAYLKGVSWNLTRSKYSTA